jgi:hypothetical protein
MPEMRMNPRNLRSHNLPPREEPLSVAERQLRAFVDTASELVGPDAKGRLREIWLDELACMDCMPEPSSPKWRLVTEAALRRLVLRLAEKHSSHLWSGDPNDALRIR